METTRAELAGVGEAEGHGYSRTMAANKGTHVRLPDELWQRVDQWRREHPDLPSRPLAIKELAEGQLDVREALKGIAARIDGWRGNQPDHPGLGEALRRLVEQRLDEIEARKPPAGAKPRPAPRGKPKKGE